jgi:glucan phosphoethanolaminetransferase (alkaline phosphatase superfamily)
VRGFLGHRGGEALRKWVGTVAGTGRWKFLGLTIRWATFCSLLVVVILLVQRLCTTTVVSFQLEVREARPVAPGINPCFYYDTGGGFLDAQTVCFSYDLRSSHGFQNYNITLPSFRTIRKIRFDPLQEPGIVALRRVTIGRYRRIALDLRQALGHTLFSLRESQLTMDGDTLVVRLSTDDPQVMLADQLDASTGLGTGDIFEAGLLALLICLGLAALRGLDRIVRSTRVWLVKSWHDPSFVAFKEGTALGVSVWVAIVGLILLVHQWRTPSMVTYQIAVREGDLGGNGFLQCFYFDTGRGFSDAAKTCFPFDRGPVKEFQTYQIELPAFRTIKRLRFDPMREPGVAAIRNVTVGRYRFSRVNLGSELGKTLYPLSGSQLSMEGETLVAHLSGEDPYFMLSDGFDRRTGIEASQVLGAAAMSFLICAGLLMLLMLARSAGLWERDESAAEFLRRSALRLLIWTRATVLGILSAFLVAITGTTVFAVGTSMFRYGRSISLWEVLLAPAEGVAISLLAAMVVAMVLAIDHLCAGRRWAGPLRFIPLAMELIIALVLTLLALFEILCCYVFWEWGSFVDGSLIQVAYQSPSPDSVRYYLTRAPAIVAGLAVVALIWFAIFACRKFRERRLPMRLLIGFASLAAVWSLGALSPFRTPDAYDPSVSSPLVIALQTGPTFGKTLGPNIVATDPASFQMPAHRPVPASYQHYHGAANGQDVIFVVLESVRRADVSLYGYARETTPNLTRLSNHAMVFSNAYVSQPRSCKTMESFSLGTYPDPRYDSLTWHGDRIAGRQSFWGTLAHDHYRAYLGINADPEADRFGSFMKAALGPALEQTVGLSDLVVRYGEAAKPPGSMGNDKLLVDDFLQWYGARTKPAAAVIWFAGAHHPYWAAAKKFPEHQVIDGYDNCIHASDAAVGHLIEGIEKTGRHPLILIFGDHGEAFGEHAGDQLHGVYLYNQSMRIPMMLYDSALFSERQNFDGRFSMKDVPATLLYLLGHDEPIGQSEVIFSKRPEDTVYMSNVYGDFKLGAVAGSGPEKFMYLPSRGQAYLFELGADPGENENLVASRPREEIQHREQDLIQWYFYQTDYLDKHFPIPNGAAN